MKRSAMIVVIVILAIMLIGLVLIAVMPNLNIGGQQPTEPEQTEATQEKETVDGNQPTTAEPPKDAPEVEEDRPVEETLPEAPTVQMPLVPFDDPPAEETTEQSGETGTEAPTDPAQETEPVDIPEPAPTSPLDPGLPNMTPLY